MRPRILITESTGFSTVASELLSTAGEVIVEDLDRASLLAAAAEATVLWVRLRHRIDAEVLSHAPQLRLVASPTTGLDHIDLEEAARHGVDVISLRGAAFLKDVRATAELTIGLMLALLRRIPAATRDVMDGRWNRDAFKGRELCRKTVGIVGYGRLGRLVAGYLRAFGSTVIAADPVAADDMPMTSLTELLETSDIVTVHVNLTPETVGLIGAREIARMKRGAVLINTSRGELIDDAALLQGLATGQLAGAALDVLTGENSAGVGSLPLVAYAREHDELIITPHLGGCTFESMEQTEVYLAERVCAVLSTMIR